MADFLSGISAGVNEGLSSLVANKRAERQASRENRRYEQELTFRLGTAAQARREREKMFAYQQARDKTADKQWMDSHGLRADMFEEDKRSNLARETSATAEREQRAEQFDETMGFRWEDLNQRIEESDATQQYRQDTLAESITARKEGNELARDRNQTNQSYYDDLIRLKEQELNQEPSILEQQKLRAEIDRLKAQAEYYRRPQAGSGGPPTVPLATGRNIAQELSQKYAEYFDDQGREWRAPFTSYGPDGGSFGDRFFPSKGFGFRRDKNLPWDSTDPNAPTQKQRLSAVGSDMFEDLVAAYGGNVQAAYQHLSTTVDSMLDNEDLGDKIYERLRRSLSKEQSNNDDMLTIRKLARDEILRGAIEKHSELVGQATAPNTTGTENDPALNFR